MKKGLSYIKPHIFWDVDINNLSQERHWFFIIERVLEFGDLADVKALLEDFSRQQIVSVLQNSRLISPKTLAYFKAIGYVS